jgi:iron complex outermembrane receptor protein
MNLSLTKLFEYQAEEFKTAPALENAGTIGVAAPGRGSLYDWRSIMTLRYGLASWNVGLSWQHLPSIRSNAYVTDPLTTTEGAESYDLFALSGDWNINDVLAISGGVDNLFDKEPPRIGAGRSRRSARPPAAARRFSMARPTRPSRAITMCSGAGTS